MIAYFEIGYLPEHPDDFSIGYIGYMELTFPIMILRIIVPIITWLMVIGGVLIPLFLIGAIGLLIFHPKWIVHERGFWISIVGSVLPLFLLFQERLGLENLIYCFICWFVE